MHVSVRSRGGSHRRQALGSETRPPRLPFPGVRNAPQVQRPGLDWRYELSPARAGKFSQMIGMALGGAQDGFGRGARGREDDRQDYDCKWYEPGILEKEAAKFNN